MIPKFRAWDEEEKRMIYFGLHQTDQGYHTQAEAAIDDMPTMQFTGLKDKNGKEIYEGDICLAALPEARFPVEVIWCKEKAGFLFQWKDDTYESGKDEMEMDLFTDIEVIGNIHGNPKLLEENKNGNYNMERRHKNKYQR